MRGLSISLYSVVGYLPNILFTWVTILPVPNQRVITINTTFITMSNMPLNMNLGAKIFHTIKCLRKLAANIRLDKLMIVWYVSNVVMFVTICDNTDMGLFEGLILHNVIKGIAKQIIINDPNVFNAIFK